MVKKVSVEQLLPFCACHVLTQVIIAFYIVIQGEENVYFQN